MVSNCCIEVSNLLVIVCIWVVSNCLYWSHYKLVYWLQYKLLQIGYQCKSVQTQTHDTNNIDQVGTCLIPISHTTSVPTRTPNTKTENHPQFIFTTNTPINNINNTFPHHNHWHPIGQLTADSRINPSPTRRWIDRMRMSAEHTTTPDAAYYLHSLKLPYIPFIFSNLTFVPTFVQQRYILFFISFFTCINYWFPLLCNGDTLILSDLIPS